MSDIIELFLSQSYEKEINKMMLYYNYEFPVEAVLNYVRGIIQIPIGQLLSQLEQLENEDGISPKDVYQFSDLDNATFRLCRLLKEANNPGVTSLNAGELLLNDGKSRKPGALIKYGENHVKTAEAVGLVYEMAHVYFLSCIGYVTDLLATDEQERLLLRLILRNKLVSTLLSASHNGIINMRQFLYMLSDSTYTRRRSNIKTILRVLEQSSEYDFSTFLSSIVFP